MYWKLLDLMCRFVSPQIHTYRHDWPFQSFSQDYGLASHATDVKCFNFIRECRDLQFNVDSERLYLRIFVKLFMAGLLAKEIFFLFILRSDDWPGIRNRAFTFNKPTHYLLVHGALYYKFDKDMGLIVKDYFSNKIRSVSNLFREHTQLSMIASYLQYLD